MINRLSDANPTPQVRELSEAVRNFIQKLDVGNRMTDDQADQFIHAIRLGLGHERFSQLTHSRGIRPRVMEGIGNSFGAGI
jgi:hypothetical protein